MYSLTTVVRSARPFFEGRTWEVPYRVARCSSDSRPGGGGNRKKTIVSISAYGEYIAATCFQGHAHVRPVGSRKVR